MSQGREAPKGSLDARRSSLTMKQERRVNVSVSLTDWRRSKCSSSTRFKSCTGHGQRTQVSLKHPGLQVVWTRTRSSRETRPYVTNYRPSNCSTEVGLTRPPTSSCLAGHEEASRRSRPLRHCEDLDLRLVQHGVLESLVKAGASDSVVNGNPLARRYPRGVIAAACEHGTCHQRDPNDGQVRVKDAKRRRIDPGPHFRTDSAPDGDTLTHTGTVA